MSRKQPTPYFTTTLLLILLLPAGYMGAYYAMLDGIEVREPALDSRGLWKIAFVPMYRVDGQFVESFFSPAQCIDRHIRWERWNGFGDCHQQVGRP